MLERKNRRPDSEGWETWAGRVGLRKWRKLTVVRPVRLRLGRNKQVSLRVMLLQACCEARLLRKSALLQGLLKSAAGSLCH